MIERLFSPWQFCFARMQYMRGRDVLKAGLALHKLELTFDSIRKSKDSKKKEHPEVLLRCPAVGAKKTGDAYKRRLPELVPNFFEKFLLPSPRLIEVTFSGSRLSFPWGQTRAGGRDHRSFKGQGRGQPFPKLGGS